MAPTRRLLCALVLVLAAAPSASAAAAGPAPGTLIYRDDFSGSSLNASVWNVLEQVHR